MYQEQHPEEPTTRLVLWEEDELNALGLAYAEKVGFALEEGEENAPWDLLLSRAYVDRAKHLHEVHELYKEVIEDMVATLRAFSGRSEEEALASVKRVGASWFASIVHVERLRLGDLAEEMANQLEDPEYDAKIQALEAQLDLPMSGDSTSPKTELPTAGAEAEEAA